MEINTGGFMMATDITRRCVSVPCSQTIARGVNIPIFTPETPLDCDLSYVIELQSGRTISIDAWNLPENRTIYINRVVVGSFQPLTCDNTNRYAMMSFRGKAGQVIFTKRMDLGNKDYWKLTSEKSQIIWSVPGMYQLELESTDMLGQVMQVEYSLWPNMPGMPKEYWGGIL